ncbi:tryptophanase [Haloarchaeobius sp. HME9146]|uniref:tryptophanase n=1 Tax=Haloarchaeobius sp. HME9146 TaxID=2978732 RepID=UPI0021C0F14C|nr:tryptophanase [Haloarchaeobius sp. HME9146]MCT9094852.1 tryptophanase [Haloarchaeobius sp. HME9146]
MTAYKSKMVERIHLPAREEREANLEAAGYNVFNLDSESVFIDLLTDSGTGTMSDQQWAALIRGDESYAGARSFHNLESAVEDVMGFPYVVPAHQGRGAENILYGALVEEGDTVLNNTHFDTTRAHIANQGADPVDCPVPEARDLDAEGDFKGNFSIEEGRKVVEQVGAENVPAVVLTITNNSAAGQPVSVENTRKVREFCDEINATFVLDACRFAENAYFVTQREAEFTDSSVAEVAREQLSYADAAVMSGKKDGLSNIGGFVACHDETLYEQVKQRGILYEGFATYGGMSGRDIEALAVGLREAVEEAYISDRVGQVQYLGQLMAEEGLPVFQPIGGHAVYLDAGEFFPHIPAEEFPGQALVCELYREGGVRCVELGSFAFPDSDRPELVRMAVPRRTYHKEHIEHIVDTAKEVWAHREEVDGLEITKEPEMKEIRHFTAELEPRA